MKRFLFATLIIVGLGFSQNAEAKIPIFYSNGETISTTQTLPEEAIIDNKHVNVGVMYEQFSIFWIPIWNYGEVKHVLVNDAEDTYWELDDELKENIKSEFDVEVAEEASIPFWTQVGAKPLIILLIAFLIYSNFFAKKEEEEYEEATEENTDNDK